jgi:fructose-1-phosphate kinase PfkB-like protein
MPSRHGGQGTTPSECDRTTGKDEQVRDTAGGAVEAGVRDVVVTEDDRGALGISRRGVRHVATTTHDLPSERQQNGRAIICRS